MSWIFLIILDIVYPQCLFWFWWQFKVLTPPITLQNECDGLSTRTQAFLPCLLYFHAYFPGNWKQACLSHCQLIIHSSCHVHPQSGWSLKNSYYEARKFYQLHLSYIIFYLIFSLSGCYNGNLQNSVFLLPWNVW